MVTFKEFLLEGGAAGHMAHPFDLPGASTGKGLITVFNRIANSLSKKPSVVKIDGVNTSIKLITNQEGIKEFAMDRGSNKPEDVYGVTINTLNKRFPAGHGMLETGKIVLNIFNQAIPSIQPELKKLKLWNNPKILFNMEFVKGATNVVGYANNFLAIHGLNEIIEVKSPVRGSMSRASREIPYDKKALNSLIAKVDPIAKKQNFNVVHEFEVTLSTEVNFNEALNQKLTINYDTKNIQTQTLGQWLSKAKNPRADKIKLSSGKTISAMSLENYKNVTGGVPMNTYIGSDKKSIQRAIDGAVFYYATILMGDVIKNAASSSLGNLNTQEGIVVRDASISPNPVKITGGFILSKETGKFHQLKSQQNEEEDYLTTVDNINSPMNYQTNPPYGKEGSRLTLTPKMPV